MDVSVQADAEEIPGQIKNILLPGSLASIESLSMPLVQEVVISADIHCVKCQKRVADIMSRLKETESVLVSTSEKKVIITCKYAGVVRLPSTHAAVFGKPLSNRTGMIKRLFRPYRS